jgi:hypothetical protein
MIAAKDPLGGGLDCTGATEGVGLAGTFWGGVAFVAADAADVLLLIVGFGGTGLGLAAKTGFCNAFGIAGATVGLVATVGFMTAGLLVILVSGLGGRGSESSAFRFTPTFALVGGTGRSSSDFRSTFLGTAAGAGEAGA